MRVVHRAKGQVMRIAIVLAVAAAFASPAVADVRHPSVPERLWGSWSASSDGCGAGDKSVIVLAAKSYDSAGAKCAVDWVNETAGPRGPIYSAHVRCPGQSPQQATNVIIRPDDAQQISVGPNFGSLKPYRKCAAKPWSYRSLEVTGFVMAGHSASKTRVNALMSRPSTSWLGSTDVDARGKPAHDGGRNLR